MLFRSTFYDSRVGWALSNQAVRGALARHGLALAPSRCSTRAVPTTLQALLAFLIGLLPGAAYAYGFERQAIRQRADAVDRVLRLLTATAVVQAVLAPITYQLFRTLVATGRVADGRPLPPWVWAVIAAYPVVPLLVGDAVGRASRRNRPWARVFTGPSPAPRSWDHLFGRDGVTGWVRLRLLDPGTASGSNTAGDGEQITGRWLIGAYSGDPAGAVSSYAAGYPEAQDLYLADTAECDPQTGKFLLDASGKVVLRGVAVLVRWDQVAYLEYIQG